MRNVPPHVQIHRLAFAGVALKKTNSAINEIGIAPARIIGTTRTGVVIDDVDAVGARLGVGADVPFAKVTGAIAIALEKFRDSHTIAKAMIGHVLGIRRRELPRHRPRAAGATGNPRDVCLCEARAVFGQLVEHRRFGIRVAITAEVAIAEVIGENKDDVRLVGGGNNASQANNEKNYTADHKPNFNR